MLHDSYDPRLYEGTHSGMASSNVSGLKKVVMESEGMLNQADLHLDERLEESLDESLDKVTLNGRRRRWGRER